MPAKYCLLYRLQYSNVLAPLLASAVRCHVSSVHSTYTRGMRIGIWSQDIPDLRISRDIPRILKSYPGISASLPPLVSPGRSPAGSSIWQKVSYAGWFDDDWCGLSLDGSAYSHIRTIRTSTTTTEYESLYLPLNLSRVYTQKFFK